MKLRLIDKIFEWGILIKSLFGFLEVLSGTALAISGRKSLKNLIIALTRGEIAEDPKDLIANFLIRTSQNLSLNSHIFIVAYLIFHGLVDIFLAIALLKNKLWAYPWAVTGFSLFIIYQIYRYCHTHSLILLFITIFDILIVLVILLEYKNRGKIKKNHA